MKGLLWFAVGLVVGLIAMWAYSAYVMAPNAAEEARVEVLKTIEADKQAQGMFLRAVVSAIDEEKETVTVVMAGAPGVKDDEIEITVTTDEKTVITSEQFGLITIENLVIGLPITVMSNEAIGNRTTIYATNIYAN